MDKIAKRLKAYIDAHPFDSGDSECETVLDQLYQAYAEPHESDPPDISNGFRNWKNSSVRFLWKITTPSLISAAAYAAPTNEKLLSMVSNTAYI